MASVTLSVEPKLLEPLNSDVWYKTISGSSSVSNFKYIFRPVYRLEPFTGPYIPLNIYKVPPRPITGEGLFTPNRVLKSYLENNVDPFQVGFFSATNSLIEYKVEYGFEYNPSLVWADTYNTAGNVGLTFSFQHGLSQNDLIILDKDNKTLNTSYDGTCSVISVVNNYHIKTDIPWGVDTYQETGTIISLQRMSATSSGRWGYNGTKQYEEINTDFSTKYLLSATSSLFLTNMPQQKYITLDDYETISMILPLTSTNYVYNVKTYDANGNLLVKYQGGVGLYNDKRRVDFGIGPMNLSGASFTNVSYYDFFISLREPFHNGNVSEPFHNGNVSETKRFIIDTKCSNYVNNRVCFLNRAGGYDYFNFKLDSKRNINITRNEYDRVLDYNYQIGDRGRTILSQKGEITRTIVSDWITEKESIWLEELLSSPEVFILSGTTKLPIIITDNSYEVKTVLRNSLFNLIINFKYSYGLNLQNQ